MREGYFVLCSDRMADDDLVDVVELVPILIEVTQIAIEWFELGSSWDGDVECLCSEEGLEVEEIVIVLVDDIGEQLIGESMQVGHCIERKVPLAVRRAIDFLGVLQWLVVIKPIIHCIIFLLIELHVDRLKRLHLHDIVPIIKWCLLIIKGRKAHSLEVPAVSFFPPHHDPHGSPLCSVNRLNHLRNLINKGNGSCDVIQYLYCPDLFPGHWYVLKQLVDAVRSVFKRAQEDSLVGSVLPTGEICVVLDDFPEYLRRKGFLLRLNKSMLLFF